MSDTDQSTPDSELAAVVAGIAEFNRRLAEIQAQAIVFRLYHDEQGRVITYTTENLPGNYITITREQFAEARPDVLVVDGRIELTHAMTKVRKLHTVDHMPAQAASRWDVNIVADPATDTDWQLWSMTSNDL